MPVPAFHGTKSPFWHGGAFATFPRRRSLPAGNRDVIKRRPIRNKLLLGGTLVGIMVAVLSASSFLGVYSYRRLVRSLSCRAAELPLASDLNASVGSLRLAHARALSGEAEFGLVDMVTPVATEDDEEPEFADTFTGQSVRTRWTLDRY